MSRILIISDLHEPYSHTDSFAFLEAIKKKYKPERVVCIGDELDYHALSFHDSDPDLPNASKELELGLYKIKMIESYFQRWIYFIAIMDQWFIERESIMAFLL